MGGPTRARIRHPRGWATSSMRGAIGGFVMLVACNDPAPPPAPAAAPPPPPPATIKTVEKQPSVTLAHASELAALDLTDVEALDLGLSETDRLGYVGDHPAATACDALDLTRLQKAPKLRKLRLSGCGDKLATGLGSLRLRELELSEMVLDAAGIEQLAQLDGLQTLAIERVTTTTPLRPLRALQLQALELRDLEEDTPFAELPSYWARTLQRLQLHGKWIDHDAFSHALEAKHVTDLEVVAPALTSVALAKLDAVSGLQRLVITSPGFNDASPFFLRNLPLRELDCNCPRFGDHGIENLRHFKEELRVLGLHDTAVTVKGLALLEPLRHIETLRLVDSELEPEVFAALARLSGLRHLVLSGKIRDPKLTGLEALKSLERLHITSPNLDDRAAGTIGQLSKLRELDVRGSQISDAALSQLGQLTALRTLRLARTRVTGRGLPHLKGLANLETLDLGHTDIMDESLEHLRPLPRLKNLRLDHTLVTDRGVAVLQELPALERLDLSHTVVSENSANALASFPKLQAVGLQGTRLRAQAENQ